MRVPSKKARHPMKLCAMTMVYQDHWALAQWYAHFSALLGAQNLYIVVHGPDDTVAARCPGANIWHIPRDDLTKFDKRRTVMLNHFASGLSLHYDRVIRTDADELVCFDPAFFSSLGDVFAQHKEALALFALGVNIMEMPDDAPYDEARAIGAQRRNVWFSGHYSKAISASAEAELWRHGAKILDRPLRSVPFAMPQGLYLVHLKFAHLAQTARADAVRRAVANPEDGATEGLPGDAWKFAQDDTRKLLGEHYARAQVEWETARDEAYAEISTTPKRFRKTGLIKARSLKYPHRADIPDWMADQLAPLPAPKT